MASAKASKKRCKPSQAFRNLQYSLGKTRVSLDELHTEELEELLRGELESIETRELRGFNELTDVLQERDSNNNLRLLSEAVTISDVGVPYSISFKSHVLRICRWVTYKFTYRPFFRVRRQCDHRSSEVPTEFLGLLSLPLSQRNYKSPIS